MRATHDHAHTARRLLGALAVVVATTLVSAAPAVSADDRAKSKTPLAAYKRFAFEFEAVVATNDGSSSGLTISTDGVYVGPRSQDCAATVSFGPGLELSEHVVVIGKKLWIDEGHGFKTGRHGDFEFEGQCPSSPKFWAGFPFADLPSQLHGTAETRDGVAVERVDLTAIFDTVFTSGVVGNLPSDVTAERALLWRTKHDGFVVGLDLAMRGNSADTCREMLEVDADAVAPATCTMTVRFDLSRFDDPKLTVRARGSNGSKGHVTRT